MKIIKIALSVVVILFAVFGLFKILPFDITNPVMFFALATLLLVRTYEYRKNHDKVGVVLTLLSALFVYIVTFYNIFAG